jgi:hypothetical protein
MNTPAHLILGAAAFGKPSARGVTWAAIAGAFAPDLSLYVMVAVSIFLLGHSPELVFGQFYYGDAWQQVFAIDNSFIFWGLGCAVAIWRKSAWAVAFTAAALLHLALDFPLHNHDARMHFWPITDWKFISPVSYWQGARGGDTVGAIELALSAACLVYLFRAHRDLGLRICFGLLALAQLATTQIWRLFF